MTFPVTYYCPHCGAVAELQRDGYLADQSVTPYPLEGWRYVDAAGDYEADDADGVRLVCGEDSGGDLRWTGDRSGADDVAEPDGECPCGRTFYLSFVRHESGERVEPTPESDYVRLGR